MNIDGEQVDFPQSLAPDFNDDTSGNDDIIPSPNESPVTPVSDPAVASSPETEAS